MKLHYLDCSSEKASVYILSELGVSTSTIVQKTANASPPSTNLSREHRSNHPVSYKVVAGEVCIDIRDEADCWIQAVLLAGDELTIPSTLYRRVTGADAKIIEKSDSSDSYVYRYDNAADGIALNNYHNYRELVCELCRQFFTAGWVTGTGGSISIKYGNRIYMTPSGVQKERIQPDELYVLDVDGEVLSVPQQKPGSRVPKLSDCAPLFLHAFKQRGAGAVLHSHSMCCNLVTSLFEGESYFKISHQEMIKGIAGYGYFDELCIPIIENTAWEHELADSLGEAIAKNPKSVAILVRRHGMYVWGKTWEEAKRHGECLHYLFEIAISMKKLGMDFQSAPAPLRSLAPSVENGSKKRSRESSIAAVCALAGVKYVLLDIEGTTTPISFVKDVLFPYSAKNFKTFLEENWGDAELMDDLKLLQVDYEAEKGPFVPDATTCASFLSLCVAEDRKCSYLKNIQGRIWDKGYSSGSLKSEVYLDIMHFFMRANARNIKIAIYSSGSRKAQKLLFKYSNLGDLRDYISCYFDTSVGLKQQPSSYTEIVKSLGVDNASEIMFFTDILAEGQAAVSAGMRSMLAVRPGNAALPAKHGFTTVSNFEELLL